jgi:hypothetical protein
VLPEKRQCQRARFASFLRVPIPSLRKTGRQIIRLKGISSDSDHTWNKEPKLDRTNISDNDARNAEKLLGNI